VILLLRLQTQAKQILIDNTASTPVIAMADKEMIGLVLRNLLTNAVKFTPQGGKITIGVNACEDFVEVYVQDTGTGISKEALQKINENNYFTTKGTASESGTGLGLMLCRDFLSRNSGQLFIESKIGEGSTFSFTLPAGE
jgi:signal transduction histidine kinase